jgi:hypothetical protein
MKINRLAIEAMLVGFLLVASVLLGLDRASSQASPIRADNSVPDTMTIARLTRAYDQAGPAVIQAATDVTETAVILAAGLLLDQPYYLVNLPIISN